MLTAAAFTAMGKALIASADSAKIVFTLIGSETEITYAATIVSDDTGVDSDGNVVIAIQSEPWTQYRQRTIRVTKVLLYDEDDNVLVEKDESIIMALISTTGTDVLLNYRLILNFSEFEIQYASEVSF